MQGILGKKIGMTQIFLEDGRIVPVTIIEAGPCLVVQRKSRSRDGYEAIQLGLVEGKAPRRVPQSRAGHFKNAGVPPMLHLMEFSPDQEEEWNPGDEVKVSVFKEDDYVDVSGTSKGKGFQGVVKRHGYGGGRATHGSMFHRAPGSIGCSAYPSRVFKGKTLPGRTGGKKVTAKNLLVIKVDEQNSLIYIRGAVPGSRKGYVALRHAKRG